MMSFEDVRMNEWGKHASERRTVEIDDDDRECGKNGTQQHVPHDSIFIGMCWMGDVRGGKMPVRKMKCGTHDGGDEKREVVLHDSISMPLERGTSLPVFPALPAATHSSGR